MSKKLIGLIVGVVVLGVGTFIALRFFKGSDKHLILVPRNATFVMRFDVKSLADKIYANGDIKQTKLYKELEKKSTDADAESKVIAQILRDPSSLGINIFSDVYYYMYNTKSVNYNAFVLDIKDLEDFNRTVLKFPHAKDNLVKGKEFNYIKLNSRSIMAWNNTGLLMLNKEYSWFYDESPNESIEKVVKGFMTMSKESSIKSDKDFMAYIDNKDDISMYLSYEKFNRMLQVKNLGEDDETAKTLKMLNGVAVGVGLEFEDDAIVGKSKVLGDLKAYEKFNYMGKSGLSEKALSVICKDKLLAMIGLNFDVDKLISVIGNISGDEKGIRRGIEEMAGDMGLTSKQLISAIGSELSIALLGFETRTIQSQDYAMNFETGNYEFVPVTKLVAMPVMTMSMEVKNNPIFEKILSKMPSQLLADGSRKVPLHLFDSTYAYLVLKDKILFMSNDEKIAAKVQKEGSLGSITNSEVKDLAKDHPMSFYLDLDVKKYQALANAYGMSGGQVMTYFTNYMALFKDVTGYYKGYNSEMRINFNKGKGNSLYRLVKQMDELPVETW